ncbi:hypothetical protein [Paractinoplanes durhamensis]|uniref:Lipoprotein n=1 Tax=Paractinoplanes durhamensis TaxID=113563 RepID=A0ABQ3ZA90_9ACTN|nr:hypothetical protein [Actinoplanes durhamensis]GIE06742.1 hypothetical protein Adu01nite_80920 [Actinoplanes durhamensis]
MPHRRLAVLPLALIATAGLTAGCAIELKPESLPVPFSVAPTPSASAGVPAYVCTAAYKILTDGAVRLAGYLSSSSDSAKDGMRDTFTEMAAKLDAEAVRTPDADLKQALSAVSADLNTAAKGADPKSYVNGGFVTVGQKLDGACADA